MSIINYEKIIETFAIKLYDIIVANTNQQKGDDDKLYKKALFKFEEQGSETENEKGEAEVTIQNWQLGKPAITFKYSKTDNNHELIINFIGKENNSGLDVLVNLNHQAKNGTEYIHYLNKKSSDKKAEKSKTEQEMTKIAASLMILIEKVSLLKYDKKATRQFDNLQEDVKKRQMSDGGGNYQIFPSVTKAVDTFIRAIYPIVADDDIEIVKGIRQKLSKQIMERLSGGEETVKLEYGITPNGILASAMSEVGVPVKISIIVSASSAEIVLGDGNHMEIFEQGEQPSVKRKK